jgi:alpha-beta hydrolase superfamily lysophospholipase
LLKLRLSPTTFDRRPTDQDRSMENTKARFRLPRYIRWILWVLLVQFILVNISAALYAYKFTHVSSDPALKMAKPAKNIFAKTWRLFTGPRQARSTISQLPVFNYDTVMFKTRNGIAIEAWYAQPDSGSKGTVILFHGLASNKGNLLQEADEFLYLGYNVMLVDLRAHGNSGGSTISFGIRETEEVKLAYDHIKSKGEKTILLWGSSMGAVVVTKAVADHQLAVAGIMLEMPFASLQTHLQARARALGFQGFPEKPFGFLVSWWMGVEGGFKGAKHRTTTYAKKINVPVLLQWGAQDNYVLQKETDRVFSAIASPNKKLVVYDRAGHESLLQHDPVKWRIETERFLAVNSK